MALRLGFCTITLQPEAEPDVTSRWCITEEALQISLNTKEIEHHDIALELLLCLGQVLWGKLSELQVGAYWRLLADEMNAGIEGEIDEQALAEKQALLKDRRAESIASYGRASFAGTVAEYVHALWHDVTIRRGRKYLPAEPLRRRLRLLAQWFPPDRGHLLFPPRRPRT